MVGVESRAVAPLKRTKQNSRNFTNERTSQIGVPHQTPKKTSGTCVASSASNFLSAAPVAALDRHGPRHRRRPLRRLAPLHTRRVRQRDFAPTSGTASRTRLSIDRKISFAQLSRPADNAAVYSEKAILIVNHQFCATAATAATFTTATGGICFRAAASHRVAALSAAAATLF